MKYIKENLKFFIFMIIMCIIGGYFITIYSLNSLDPSLIEEGIKQVGSEDLLIIISVIQVSIYAIIFSGIGIILSNRIGLWKKIETNKKAIQIVILTSIIGGLCLTVLDKYVFGSLINGVSHLFDERPTLEYIIGAFTYGGIFEEVLMRLFLMSLLSYLIIKIFYKKEKKIPTKVFVISNIVCALLFAAGHLPQTKALFGYIDTFILVRCFLLNGAFGLVFGWLYRKYGIAYSMLTHFGCHFVAIIIRLFFI